MSVFDEWTACGHHLPQIDVYCELEAGHDRNNPTDPHSAVYAAGVGVTWVTGSTVARFTGPRAHLIRRGGS